VVNLYAYRATSPLDLDRAGYPVGPENDSWIEAATREAVETGGDICVAWGSNANRKARPAEVLRIIRAAGGRTMCLGRTHWGQPIHPLYVPSSRRLQEFK